MKHNYCKIAFIIFFLFTGKVSYAQSLLDTRVNISTKNKQIKYTLGLIEKQCNCSFSYNSTLVHEDSVVNISVSDKSVKQVLQMMFGDRFQFKTIDDHIIILSAEKEKWFTVSGYVRDAVTGAAIADASVFERQQLSSVLSNSDGSFRLKIKDRGRYAIAEITFSKGGFYADTSVNVPAGYNEDISVALYPANHTLPDIQVTPYANVERSWFGRHFFSSNLRKQSANLGKFFVDKPVQASFVPGVGSHGKLSGQVTNRFSFNALGGYAAGVDGFELGGLFNIDKKNMRYAQVGGLLNIVSGSVTGVQVGGITNKVGKSMSGAQISGITSLVGNDINGVVIAGICSRSGGSMKGVQISGITNIVAHRDTAAQQEDTAYGMKGMQLAGVMNIVNHNGCGFQLAGVTNICRGNMKGLQMSGICNITRKLEGSQIGLINIADTVTGYTIGLINIVKKGYHTLTISTSELLNLNVAYKAGTKKLYNIITICGNIATGRKAYAYGLGAGTERAISRKTGISAEVTALSLYEGSKNNDLILIKIEPAFNWNISRRFSLYTGPCLRFIPYTPPFDETGYRQGVPSSALYNFNTPYNTAAWVGWQIGFHIF